MIYKRCARCGKRIPSGTTCGCYGKAKKGRVYAKPEGINKEYHTQRWRDLRDAVLSAYYGIDLYALYRHGRVVPAATAHHIEPTGDCPGLFYAFDNLIPVSRQAHMEIHDRYKNGDKKAVQEELRGYIRRFREAGGTGKVF